MKITKGPLLQKYGDCFGVPVDEVIEWVSGYVNGPWPESLIPQLEPTEQERLTHIKAYIASEVKNSVTGRIKADLELREAA